jgi:hypothetical protein
VKWVYLIAALVLLLPPLPISSALRQSLSRSRRNGNFKADGAVLVWQNWADLVRALVGTYAFTIWWSMMTDTTKPGNDLANVALTGSVFGVALVVQTVRFLRGVQFLGPVFYLSGVTLILSMSPGGSTRWAIAQSLAQPAFAVGVGWLFAVVGKNLAYQLPAMAVALATAGYVLGSGGLPLLLLNCTLIFLPMVLSTLFRKRLLFAAVGPAPA